jgi:tetratricopeptide (TPR) repeat protein
MYLRIISILTLVLITSFVSAQTYDELLKELESATGKTELHRLGAQLARAGIQRLETEQLSKTAQKKLKAEVLAQCSDVQLGAMDIWFGDSVVTWSRLLLLEGNWREARSILLGQAEVLQNIEKNLAANEVPVSAISPLAGCRYYLGETYRMEYEETNRHEPAVAALRHFYNVYIKYGDSPWGGAAQQKADAAKGFVEGRGRQVRIELGSHRDAFVANTFKLGVRLAAQGAFEEAIDPLTAAINYFPESGKSVDALRTLGICWFNLERHGEVLATVEYLCERFSSDTNAPAAVLCLGRQSLDAAADAADPIFGHYLAAFPLDSHRTDILSYFAWQAYNAGNGPETLTRFQALESALRADGEMGEPLEKAVYIQASCARQPAGFDRFLAEFPESGLVPRVLGEKAQALLVAGEFDAAFQTLEILGERHPDAPAARTALAGLIVAAVEKERFDIAGQVLDRMLADREAYGNGVYVSTGESLLKAGEFVLAEKTFSAVQPETERSLLGLAAAQSGQEQFGESFQSLGKLLTTFPNSGHFYDARLMQARALVELGRTNEAIAAYGDVVAARQDYQTAFEMARILGDPEEQLAAFQRIALLADPDKMANRPLIAESLVASLPLCLELRKYRLAVDSCDQFETLFPKNDKLPTIGKFRKEAADALAQ